MRPLLAAAAFLAKGLFGIFYDSQINYLPFGAFVSFEFSASLYKLGYVVKSIEKM